MTAARLSVTSADGLPVPDNRLVLEDIIEVSNPLASYVENWGLLFLLITFLVLGVIYISATPPLETPDAPMLHSAVVKYIADHWRLPPANPASADAGPVPTISPVLPVYYAPPLYYILGATLIADLDTDGFVDGVVPNPNWARGWAPYVGPCAGEQERLCAHRRPAPAFGRVGRRHVALAALFFGVGRADRRGHFCPDKATDRSAGPAAEKIHQPCDDCLCCL